MVAPAPPTQERSSTPTGWPPLRYWASVALVVTLVVGALFQLRKASDVFVIILAAAVIAVGLDPAVRRLERRGLRRGLAVLVIVLAGLAAAAIFLWFAIPEFLDQIRAFASDLPSLLNRLAARDDWIGKIVRDTDVRGHLQNVIANAPSTIADSFGSVLGVTSRVTSLLFRLLTLGILTIYFMLGYPGARRAIAARTPELQRERSERVIETVTHRIGGYVSGKFILGALSAIVIAIVLVALGVQFWFPLAAWAGLASLIPIVGVYIGAAPAILIAFTDSTGTALLVLLFFVAWQLVHDYVLSPRIMKNAVDLSPAVVMVATIIGGSLGGLFGVLLALPVAAAIKAIANEYLAPAEPPERLDQVATR
ncbi:MAG TPA: AI-2E family transporter [Actinomycetota bacterium]|jgi:predicted PurR-regulated permease PerM